MRDGHRDWPNRPAPLGVCLSLPVVCQVVAAAEPKLIVFDAESRRKLQKGINAVADAVAVTLGPRGGWRAGVLVPCTRHAVHACRPVAPLLGLNARTETTGHARDAPGTTAQPLHGNAPHPQAPLTKAHNKCHHPRTAEQAATSCWSHRTECHRCRLPAVVAARVQDQHPLCMLLVVDHRKLGAVAVVLLLPLHLGRLLLPV
jgi:hypothetical protein